MFDILQNMAPFKSNNKFRSRNSNINDLNANDFPNISTKNANFHSFELSVTVKNP